jgi:hypothetical protein
MKRLIVLAILLMPFAAGCTLSINVGSDPTSAGVPTCESAKSSGRAQARSGLLLMAQSVRTASLVPCVRVLPVGWTYARMEATNKHARFWLDSDRGGARALRVSLEPTCDTGNALEVPSLRADIRRYDRVEAVQSGYRGDRYLKFRGGCVTYHFDLSGEGSYGEVALISVALSFVSRADLAESVREYSDDRLVLDPSPSSGHH